MNPSDPIAASADRSIPRPPVPRATYRVQFGAGYYQRFIDKGRRVSAARAFLKPALARGNVTLRENVHVLTSIDYSMMNDCDKGLESNPRPDHDYGLSWIRREGKGRVFYEALGHHESIYYNNPAMLEHILAGIQYALGDLEADDSPSR